MAVLSGLADLVAQESRTPITSRIESQPVVSLAIEPDLDPVRPAEFLEARLTVTNQSNEPLTGVVLLLQYPDYLAATSVVLISDGGDCTTVSNAGQCNKAEFVIWDLGTLGPGGGRTVTLPPVVGPANTTPDGTLIPLRARVSSDFSRTVWERRSLLVDQDRPLNLRVDVDRNPVAPGDLVKYHFTFTNRGASGVDQARLSFPLPAGTRLVAANGLPRLDNGLIIWDLGMLAPGEGGRVRAALEVDSALLDGVLLESEPTVLRAEADLQTHRSRANPTTRTETGVGVEIALQVGFEAFQAGQTIPAELVVTNTSNSVLTGVTARLFFPDWLNNLVDAQISDEGDCTTLFGGGRCDSFETVVWDLGNLASEASKTVSIPPVIQSNTPSGEMIRFHATVSDDASARAFTSMTPLVGILNGDPNGDGNVNVADLVEVIDWILSDLVDPASDCSGDGIVDVQDARCILELIQY